MKRLVTALAAGVGLMLALVPPAVSPAASNNATTLMPLADGTSWRHMPDWTAITRTAAATSPSAPTARPATGLTGFPNDLWSRQSTTIRPTDRLAYLDVHATAQYDRVNKAGGSRRSHHDLHGRGTAGEVSDHRPDRLDRLAHRANPASTSTSSPARTSRWSTAGSTSPRRAPARRPTSLRATGAIQASKLLSDNTFAKVWVSPGQRADT